MQNPPDVLDITLTQRKELFDYSFQATVLGYHPFIRISPLEYLTIVEMHDASVFERILSRIENHPDISRRSAVQILGTADRLPHEEVSKAPNLLEFLASSEPWRRANEYKRHFWGTFYRVYKRMKEDHKTMPPPFRSAYKEDLNRWRRHLKEQREHRENSPELRPALFGIERKPRIKKPEPVIIYKRKELDL